MPVGVRLKRSHDTRTRLSAGGLKESAGGPGLVDRRKDRSSGNAKWHRNEHESNDAGSSNGRYRRERRMDHEGDSDVKFKRGNFDSEFTRHKRKRNDDSQDAKEVRSSQGFRASNRKYSDDEKYTLKDASDAAKRRSSDVRFAGKRPSKPPKWKKKSDESDIEELSEREARTVRSSRTSDVRFSRERPGKGKQQSFVHDESAIEEIGDGEARQVRGHRGRKDDSHGTRDYHKSEGRGRISHRGEGKGVSAEVSADKCGSKGKKRDGFISKRDGFISTEKRKGEGEVKSLEKHSKVKDNLDQSPAKKLDGGQTQPIDKYEKRTDAPPKKRKRIRIDPYDISNKRLVDDVSDNEEETKAVEEEIRISKNSIFRAIQPSPSILSFVEENLVGRRRLIELQKAGYNVKLSAPLDNVPHSTSTERERIEENVFRSKLEFFAAAKISSSLPPPLLPEIAFAGRSNVGKSSLLNALTRQWGTVRTSDKPGYTQSINFFRLASKLCLVDLPGYGFAYAKQEVKDSWEELVKEYVSTRVGLQRVCLLIDAKWDMKPSDHELIDLMERSQTPYQIVLTKTDVVFPIDVARRAMQIQENLKANKSLVKPVMMASSKSGAGIRSLRTVLAKLTRFVKP